MAQSKRIFAPGAPHHSLKLEPKAVPWGTIAVILLALIVVFALWGKIPRRSRPSHEVPTGNAPGTSFLHSPARLPPLSADTASC